MWILINHLNCPPGEFLYEQTEGIQRKFPSTPLIRHQADAVSEFRKANGLPRSDFASCLQDVDCFTCQRLGNNPRYCKDTERQYNEVVRTNRSGGGCGTCGAAVNDA
jgi:hypothetical protein